MRFNLTRSYRLDWAITRMEATRGWRRLIWRLVKRYYELFI
jgi:hypothetical protein